MSFSLKLKKVNEKVPCFEQIYVLKRFFLSLSLSLQPTTSNLTCEKGSKQVKLTGCYLCVFWWLLLLLLLLSVSEKYFHRVVRCEISLMKNKEAPLKLPLFSLVVCFLIALSKMRPDRPAELRKEGSEQARVEAGCMLSKLVPNQ